MPKCNITDCANHASFRLWLGGGWIYACLKHQIDAQSIATINITYHL